MGSLNKTDSPQSHPNHVRFEAEIKKVDLLIVSVGYKLVHVSWRGKVKLEEGSIEWFDKKAVNAFVRARLLVRFSKRILRAVYIHKSKYLDVIIKKETVDLLVTLTGSLIKLSEAYIKSSRTLSNNGVLSIEEKLPNNVLKEAKKAIKLSNEIKKMKEFF